MPGTENFPTASRCSPRTCCAPRTAPTSPRTTSRPSRSGTRTADPSVEIQFTPPAGDHAGLHRGALHRRPGHHARGGRRPGRRPGQGQPAGTGRSGDRPLGDRRPVRPRRRVRAQRRDRVRAQRRALPVPALGPGRVQRLQGGAARHRHRAPGQHRIPGPRGAWNANGVAYPGHLRRHRLAHHDGQRPRRAGLGRRRHRGRGGHAGPAGVDADPPRGRLQADRRAPGRRHRHRRGAHRHRDAAQARRGRQVRRVLRRGRRRGAAGQPRHAGQHEPRIRLHRSDFPDRRGDHRLPADDRPQRGAAGAGRGVRQGTGHVARPRARAEVLRVHRAGPVRRGPVDRRAQAPAGPHRAVRRKDGLPQGHSQLRRGEHAGRAHQARRGRRGDLPGQRPGGAVVRRQRRRVAVGGQRLQRPAEQAGGRSSPTSAASSSSTTARW